METELKVFHSEISRVDCEEENHLYDLLKIEPAKPVAQRPPCTKDESWEFKPNYEKHYSSKRLQSKLKVNTVSHVRALFEEDVYNYLADDLEQQQNYLLRKIRDGYSNEENTKKNAIGLLNADKPISRSSWQMLSNINPERHHHSKQFVLWNGRCIQVNGSKGGKHKFICNYDLKTKEKKSVKNLSIFKKGPLKSRIGLLRNSLDVKFKPGPLRKKKFLDASHHKYQMGNIELVRLPAPGLEVIPAYGTVLEPSISSFINNLRGEKGMIPKKLAEFAVSVLGTAHNNTAEQLNENCCITFDLKYKCEQNLVLMRRNAVETTSYKNNENDSNSNKKFTTKSIQNSHDVGSDTNSIVNFRSPLEGDTSVHVKDESIFEIKQIMNEMLHSVHINLNQDTMYSKDDPRDTIADESKDLIASKDKSKKKFCELDKLAVTVINLPESSKNDYTKPCGKSFCTMGCVCESLDGVFRLKQHCGVHDCMFGCKCEVSKYKNIELEQDCGDIIPGLLNLDNEINSHLAKEEQEFHQTVIFSGDKSILLKSRKRNWKASKKYAEFYSQMNLKGDDKIKRFLTVDIERLCCKNIEPLCMVHNLYKCFCKGKFTETYVRNDAVINTTKSLNSENTTVQDGINTNMSLHTESTALDSDSCKRKLRTTLRKTYRNRRSDESRKYSLNTDDDDDELNIACARTIGYHGRKYSDDYYITTNRKVIEMEQNDKLLKKKMLRLINGKNINTSNVISSNMVSSTSDTLNKNSELLDCETLENESNHDSCDKILNETEENNKDNLNKATNRNGEYYSFANTSGKGSLQSWLETSYKNYKERHRKGVVKNCLDAPKKGKAAFLSWDFILSRYRERKNIFVVSKQEPFRSFLAVDDKHPMFANCINIDDIRFADLPKYPIIIKNLVTNATDSENVFCILRGWDHCWELIGSAVKVIEKPTGSQTEDTDFFDSGNLMTTDYSSDNEADESIDQNCESVPLQGANECSEVEQPSSTSEKSKWFLLTVENDFTEIQFYKKGFYVTYEGIQRSINLARISGKTVRLSLRTRTDKTLNNNKHPYGVYAIPCNKKCCVFIGPYEGEEPLGIEVVKTVVHSRRLKKTRGMWITTNKVDDINVIDNPLAYLPDVLQSETFPIVNTGITAGSKPTAKNDEQGEIPNQEKTKHVKPIKIRRTNGFYHLSPKNILQKITMPNLFTNKSSAIKELFMKTADESKEDNTYPSMSNLQNVMEFAPQKNDVEESNPSTSSLVEYIKPVAETTPQIKITRVYSENNLQNQGGSTMLILKPEEINNKALRNPVSNDEFATDVEKFLETSTICIAPQEEVLVISDGDDDVATSSKDVWIQCCNVEKFGYIRAKICDDNAGISFEFPGFKYSEFYSEKEAFDKINQVLARKMYIPRNFKLQWQVITEKQNLVGDILTPKCFENKKYLLIKLREQQTNKSLLKLPATSKNNTTETPTLRKTRSKKVVKTYVKKKRAPIDGGADTPNTKPMQMDIIEDLEEASRKLEQESVVLWNEAVTRRDEIFGSLSVPDDVKVDMTEALQDIMLLNEQ